MKYSYYPFARVLDEAAVVDMSRAFLGIAAGNEMVADYMNTVVNDLSALLDWKSNRVKPSVKPVAGRTQARQAKKKS